MHQLSMTNLKEMRFEILLFLTVLIVSVVIAKVIHSLWKYMSERKHNEETDEGYMQGASLDDTTTDIERYLRSKHDEDESSHASSGPRKRRNRKLNFGIVSNFMKK